MMETIKMVYQFTDDNGDKHTVMCDRNREDGFKDSEVCEMFEQFMNSVGFSESNVYKYFNE